MFKPLKPLNDKVVLEMKTPAEKTVGGLVIPETQRKEEKTEGVVMAVGPGRLNERGERLPMTVKEGDRVFCISYGGTEVEVYGKKYKIVTEGDILAILE